MGRAGANGNSESNGHVHYHNFGDSPTVYTYVKIQFTILINEIEYANTSVKLLSYMFHINSGSLVSLNVIISDKLVCDNQHLSPCFRQVNSDSFSRQKKMLTNASTWGHYSKVNKPAAEMKKCMITLLCKYPE